MTKLSSIVLLSCLAFTSACKKKDATTSDPAGAAKPTEGAPAAAAPPKAAPAVDKKLAQVGVTLSIPADAQIDEQKMDMGGVQATISYAGMSNFFVSNVGDGADSLETTQKHADAKEWKLQDKGADGTWKLEWTKPDLLDAAKLTYGVAVRTKVGAALYDCGSNGLDEAQAAALLKVCASLK